MEQSAQTHELRVYTDGRLCVPAPLLRKYAEAAGLRKIPRGIYVRKRKGGWTLSWTPHPSAKKHDLSVRDRVLFGRFPKQDKWQATVAQDQLLIEPAGQPAPKASKKRRPRAKRKAPSQVGSRPSKTVHLVQSLESALHQQTKKRVAAILKNEFEDASLLDVALVVGKNFPSLTIGDILSA